MKSTSQGPEAQKIKSMFNEIAETYDLTNDVLSLKTHHLWRKALVRWSGAQRGDSVLDCATGTGDLAIEFKKVVKDGRVFGTDFSAGMIASAPQKATKNKLDITFEIADMTALPYKDGTFDIASVSFGIRNVENRSKAIQELYRILKPGGRLMILEFGQPKNKVIHSLYNVYSTKILPMVGEFISGKKSAYRYLQESSAEFPCGVEFADFLTAAAPFNSSEHKSLSLGIAYMYKAIKPVIVQNHSK